MNKTLLIILGILLASMCVSGCGTIFHKPSKLVFCQRPTEKWGGSQSCAEPYDPTHGWHGVYRAADDFAVARDTFIGIIRWWGGSSYGRHDDTDSIDQVRSFKVEFYTTDPDSNGVGELAYRIVIPREATNPIPTKHHQLGGSDVYCFTAILPKSIRVKAGDRYWFSVSAYLDGPPMWIWFRSDEPNPNAIIDYNVNGVWDDEPKKYPWTTKCSLAFELWSSGTLPNVANNPLEVTRDSASQR